MVFMKDGYKYGKDGVTVFMEEGYKCGKDWVWSLWRKGNALSKVLKTSRFKLKGWAFSNPPKSLLLLQQKEQHIFFLCLFS